jgi:hypothetical protein
MHFELEDDLVGLLDSLDDWANQKVQQAEDAAMLLDVKPTFVTPQDFWGQDPRTEEEEEILNQDDFQVS